MSVKLADVFIPIQPDLKGFERQAAKGATKAGTKASTSFGAAFKKTLTTGSFGTFVKGGLGLGAGMAAVGLMQKGFGAVTREIGASLDAAADFEEQLAIVNTVAKLSDDRLQQLGDDVLALSREMGKPTEELTSGLYDLVSAGVPADQAMTVLRDSATLATAALSSTGESVDLMTTSINAWKLEASDSSKVMDVWAQTVANGKVTASELASSIAKVAPLASAAGVSIEEVAAAYATMTAQGTPATQAATQMQAAITALLKPNAELIKLQKELGDTTFEQMLRSEGLAATLQAVSDAASGNTATITKALGSTEAYNGMLQLTGESAGSFEGNLKDMRTATRTGGTAVGMMAERTDAYRFKQDKLNASIEALRIGLGNIMLGPAGDFTEWLADLIGPAEQVDEELVALRARLLGIDDGAADAGEGIDLLQVALDSVATAAREGGNIVTGQAFRDLDQDLKLLNVQMATNTERVQAWAAALGTTDHWIETTIAAMLDQGMELKEITALLDEQVDRFTRLAEHEQTAIVLTGALGGKMLLAADGTIVLSQSLETLQGSGEDAARKSAKLERAVDSMSTSFRELKEDAKDARQAIQNALKGDADRTLKQLRNEEERLTAQRRKARQEGKWEAEALIQARLDQVQQAIKERRIVKRHHLSAQAERKARKEGINKIIRRLGDSKEAAKDLYDQVTEDYTLNMVIKGEQRARNLMAFLESRTTSDADLAIIVTGAGLPGAARGGHVEGWTLVGEEGPEAAYFPSPGAHVLDARTTAAIGSSGQQGDYTVTHRLEMAPGSGQELAAAGFDEARLAQLLRSDTSDPRYRWAG